VATKSFTLDWGKTNDMATTRSLQIYGNVIKDLEVAISIILCGDLVT
jgi:hypothetical protein